MSSVGFVVEVVVAAAVSLRGTMAAQGWMVTVWFSRDVSVTIPEEVLVV